MLRGVFVTGTDTGVGKTVVCAALMHRFRRHVPICYWKPIQTGIEQDDDTREVTALGACRPEEVLTRGLRLRRPVSPHLAAKLSGTTIRIPALVEELRAAEAAPGRRVGQQLDARAWIVEGAGGVLVPINADQMIADLMVTLGLPVVVAARSSLGTINHTLLTLEALRSRRLIVAGVVMAGEPNENNRDAIEHYGGVPVVGRMPHFESLTPDALRAWADAALDPDGRLLEYLR